MYWTSEGDEDDDKKLAVAAFCDKLSALGTSAFVKDVGVGYYPADMLVRSRYVAVIFISTHCPSAAHRI